MYTGGFLNNNPHPVWVWVHVVIFGRGRVSTAVVRDGYNSNLPLQMPLER